jgi:predicted nucleic acid-binding protein
MCLIVDANRAHVVFNDPTSDPAVPIWDWIKKDGILVYGGKLADELGKNSEARRLLAELVRRGSALLYSPEQLMTEVHRLEEGDLCRSDDEHVIALALVSGARVLFTDDQDLMDDFRDRSIVTPPGRIYRRGEHAHLLKHSPTCGRGDNGRFRRSTRRS